MKNKRSHTLTNTSLSSTLTPVHPELLQRKCGCGKSAGLSGKCSDCRSKELILQQQVSNEAKGNKAPPVMHDILRSPISRIQPKLKIGAPNDKYEQEADRVADQIMQMPESSIQRQIEPEEEEEEETLQTKPIAEQITLLLQRQSEPVEEDEEEILQAKTTSDQSSTVSASLQNRIHALRGNGQPLPQSERAFFEPRFGTDFSQVRVHTDNQATETAQAVNARAFTLGRNVVFGAGQYQPSASEGKRLLAHELTHVIQQACGTGGEYHGSLVRESAPLAIYRIPEKHKIPSDYIYSTNCGWIDWTHFGLLDEAAALIGSVGRASKELRKERREAHIARPPIGKHLVVPGKTLKDECPKDYDSGEKAASAKSTGIETIPLPGSNQFTGFFLGFEVGEPDASRFTSHVATLNKILEKDESLILELWGFSDCIGTEHNNLTLRAHRALAIMNLLSESVQKRVKVATFAPLNRFVISNTTPEGRRRNRSVAFRVIYPPKPKRVNTIMTSKKGGRNFHSFSLVAQILKPLSEKEKLSVALGIFQYVSMEFETLQESTDVVKNSSFSEEDLPSNLIGFYMAARGLEGKAARKYVEQKFVCDAWDKSRSLAVFKDYNFVKNRTWAPLKLPPGGVWPSEFTKIKPEPPGKLWKIQVATLVSVGIPGGVEYYIPPQ